MSEVPLMVDRQGAVAVLTLNNPSRLNSLIPPMRAQLEETIPALVKDPEIRAVVITGAGRGFCSGGDFSQKRDRARPVQVHRDMARAQMWMRELILSDLFVVTAVNGPAAGAGFGLAMMGDVVFASDQAFFKAGFPTIGVSADYLLGWNLPRAVGTVRAFEILTSNRRIEAEEAERIGMVTRVVQHDALLEAALAYARQLAASPFGVVATKKLVRSAQDHALSEYMRLEAHSFALASASDDYQAGIDAFREKRTPEFTGT